MRRSLCIFGVLLTVSGCGSEPSPSASPDGAVTDVTDATAVTDTGISAPDASRGPITGAAKVRVAHYDYSLDVTDDSTRAALTVEVTEPGDCFAIQYGLPTVDSATIDAVPARAVTVSDGVLRVCDPMRRGWAVGQRFVLETRATLPRATWRPSQVGYSMRRDREGREFTYLQSWVGECDRVGPCDDSPASFATYKFTVTHPTGSRVLCPGVISAGETQTVCDFAFDGGPTYSTFAVMVGQSWRAVELGSSAGVRLTLFDIPSSRIEAAIDPERVRAFVAWMAETFGPYPYGDALRLVVVPLYWSGFEHPGNIALSETLALGRTEHTIFHEIAHQWAGDQTTLSTVNDFVWKEAMAEYLAFVFERNAGPPSAVTATLQVWHDASNGLLQHPIPVTSIPLLQFYGSAYGPGPMVLFRQLEALSSRDAVMAAIRSVLGRPRVLSIDALRMALEHETRLSLREYFSNWLVGDGRPTWPTVRVTHDTTAQTWTATFAPNGAPRGCRFDVRFDGTGDQHATLRFDLGADGQGPRTLTLQPGFTVTGVVIDPEHTALVFPSPENTGAARFRLRAPVSPWLAP